jgi:hypothetical protein
MASGWRIWEKILVGFRITASDTIDQLDGTLAAA